MSTGFSHRPLSEHLPLPRRSLVAIFPAFGREPQALVPTAHRIAQMSVRFLDADDGINRQSRMMDQQSQHGQSLEKSLEQTAKNDKELQKHKSIRPLPTSMCQARNQASICSEAVANSNGIRSPAYAKIMWQYVSKHIEIGAERLLQKKDL